MHPLIAKRRIRELDTNPQLLLVIPFNGEHISALREVLVEISRGGQVDMKSLISRLELRFWPSEAYYSLFHILATAALITNTELRTACLQHLNKNTIDIFESSTTFADCITYQEVGDKLIKYFAGNQRDEQMLLEISDGMIEHFYTGDDFWLEKNRREALYFYLISHDLSIHQPGYHDFEMLTLAHRCSLHVAMHAATMVHAAGPSSPRLQGIIRCMETGSRTMDSVYITELYTLMHQLNANESTIFVEAVYSSCAKLYSLPRHIARNYQMALNRGGWEYTEGAMSDVLAAICRTMDKAKVQPILEDLNVVCGPNLISMYRQISLSLSDADADLLIDLNNSLLVYLTEKSWIHEGDFIVPVASWPVN